MSCNKIQVTKVCHKFDGKKHACVESIPVFQLTGNSAYFFVSKLAIDVDGAPRAYHPKDRNPPENHTKALDWLANINSDDLHGIQGDDAHGPERGFFVSGTALTNPAFPENDTRHYVDAETIPYVVLVSSFPRLSNLALNTRKGDCAVVIDLKTGARSAAIFADVGRAVGEGSLKLALNLGLDPTKSKRPPKVTGFDRVDFLHIVFPNTLVPPPWFPDEISTKAEAAFEKWGGMQQARACFPKIPV